MEPEPELYWQCDCGHTNVTAPSAFKRTGSAAHVCSECERPTQLTRANCTTERRVPVGTQLPPDGIIGGEPGVEYVFAPTHDSGATVDGTKLCPLCCGTGYTGNVNDREACERCEGSGIDGYAGKLAALEAERASSRAEVENLKEVAILDSRKLDEARAEVEALTGKVRLLEAGRDDRDARILSLSNCAHGLSAQVERLKEHVTVLESGRDNSREKFVHFEGEVGRLTTETDYLRSMAKAYQDTAVERAERIAALEAVIAAQGEQAVAMSRNFHATLKVQEALNAAGLDAKVSLTSNCIEETP